MMRLIGARFVGSAILHIMSYTNYGSPTRGSARAQWHTNIEIDKQRLFVNM